MIFLKKFFFIDKLDITLINKQDRNTAIIYRNYKSKIKPDIILKIKNICKKKKIKFYLSNDVKLAIKLKLNGAYIPSFNSSFKHLSYTLKPGFMLIGSAHTNEEIRIKSIQKVSLIFISSLFKNNKNYLGLNKFRFLEKKTKKEVIALGGITKENIKKLYLINCQGFAGISYFE